MSTSHTVICYYESGVPTLCTIPSGLITGMTVLADVTCPSWGPDPGARLKISSVGPAHRPADRIFCPLRYSVHVVRVVASSHDNLAAGAVGSDLVASALERAVS